MTPLISEEPLWMGAHNMAIMRISALLYGLSASGWYTIAMVVIVRRARTISTGRVSGRALTGFYGGLMPGPAVFGLLVSVVGYDVAWGTLASSFAGAGLVALATVKAERRVISGLDAASRIRH